MIAIKDCVDQAEIGLFNYVRESREKLLTAAQKCIKGCEETCGEIEKERPQSELNKCERRNYMDSF